MSVTVKDLAMAAGVSRGTVDRVLHNRGKVKEDIAQKIRQLAKELGYTPNRASRALAAFKSPIKIGVLLPSIGNPFFDEIKLGIDQAIKEFRGLGLEVVMYEVQGYNEQDHIQAIDKLLTQKVKALCLSTINTNSIKNKINNLSEQNFPVVLLNTDLEQTKRLCYVGSDYFKAGATAACLLALCEKNLPLNILIVTGSKFVYGHNLRIKGFIEQLKNEKISFNVVKIVESKDSDLKAKEVTLKAFAKFKYINCVYVSGAGAQGVGEAITTLKRDDVFAISYDELETVKTQVEAGVFKFIICQEPIRQGYHAIKRAFFSVLGDGEQKPDDFITQTIIKVKTNL